MSQSAADALSQGTAPTSTDAEPTYPGLAYEQEIRFAVVMYGGVSLAIYINGVAQELLNLVRATAPAQPTRLAPETTLLSDQEIAGTTAEVYRELGRILHRKGTTNDGSIRTRFVVDVISGTSAGGLNGVYLAKALANDQPIDALKRLWVEEADIAKIVNDPDTYEKSLGIDRVRPPESALNSRRMYWQLLSALDGMDRAVPREDSFESPLVDELDLWVTATDVRGVTVPIDLFDRFVFEKRHKKVFRFVYGSDHARGSLEQTDEAAPAGRPRNDLRKSFNPFLAFVGRCTSAFPFAFEPMQLDDIDHVLDAEHFRAAYRERKAATADWRAFFEDYLKPGAAEALADVGVDKDEDEDRAEKAAYRTQFFADGGYLDNKPFTWATRSLGLRRADVPVDRRLIYIEPDPGAAGLLQHEPGEAGDLVEAWKAYGPLAHLDPKQARVRPNAIENSLAALTGIPRSEPIREDIEELVRRNRQLERVDRVTAIVDELGLATLPDDTKFDLGTWRALSVAEIIEKRGIQYGGYHRLKVAAVTDDLAALVARLAGFDEDSDESSAIGCYIEAWIRGHHPENGTGEQSQNEFLIRYDLGYRLRRTEFLIRQIDRLGSEWPELDFGEARRKLNDARGSLRAFGRALRARSKENPIRELVEQAGLDRTALRHVLNGARSRSESVKRAAGRLDEGALDKRLTAVADAIAYALFDVFEQARNDARAAIAMVPEGTKTRDRLQLFFDRYEIFDSVLFPTSYGAVSEGDRVEVVRISPQDATSIIDETQSGETRRKLAGSEIHHFGGFFDRGWRRNDILWGRLDAAERLVTSLLPAGGQRDDLLHKAQLAIIREEFTVDGREELERLVVRGLLNAGGEGKPPVDEQKAKNAVAAAQDPQEILDFLRTTYEVDRQPDPPSTLKTVGRLTAVTGEVLDGIVGSGTAKSGARWMTRFGRLLLGLGEISTERSFPALLWRWWAQLLLFIAILLILGGVIFGASASSKAGWIVIAFLAAVKAATWIAEELTSSGPARRRVRRALVMLAILATAFFAGWGVYSAYAWLDRKADNQVCRLPDWAEDRAQVIWPWDDDQC